MHRRISKWKCNIDTLVWYILLMISIVSPRMHLTRQVATMMAAAGTCIIIII